MAKAELGTKRTCPVTGKRFYDLDRDPITSPYTGQAYPRSYFDPQPVAAAIDGEGEGEIIGTALNPQDMVPLEVVDTAGDVTIVADDDIDLGDDEDDTFLETEEDEDDGDVSNLIDGDIEEDEEN